MNMMNYIKISIVVLGLSIQPANAQEFMIDSKGTDMSNYYSDLKECQAFAAEKSIAGEAIGGAVAGAAVGAVIGVAIEGSSWADEGASWGGIEGAAEGAYSGYEKKKDVTRQCLIGRGYKVLD